MSWTDGHCWGAPPGTREPAGAVSFPCPQHTGPPAGLATPLASTDPPPHPVLPQTHLLRQPPLSRAAQPLPQTRWGHKACQHRCSTTPPRAVLRWMCPLQEALGQSLWRAVPPVASTTLKRLPHHTHPQTEAPLPAVAWGQTTGLTGAPSTSQSLSGDNTGKVLSGLVRLRRKHLV